MSSAVQQRFTDKVVLITGSGSGAGIGGESARRFAAEGARVIIADRNRAAAEEVAGSLSQAVAHEVDVADPTAVSGLAEFVRQRFGRLDVLVHGAHHASADDLLSTRVEDLRLDLDVTLLGPMLVTRALLPIMLESGGGVVLAIGSVNGIGWYGGHGYSAAKAGLLHFTRNLAADYAGRGIRACAVAPGTIDTPAWADAKAENPALMQELGAHYPLGRVGETSDIADALLFLASDQAAWITGVVLPVDGGILLTNGFPDAFGAS